MQYDMDLKFVCTHYYNIIATNEICFLHCHNLNFHQPVYTSKAYHHTKFAIIDNLALALRVDSIIEEKKHTLRVMYVC